MAAGFSHPSGLSVGQRILRRLHDVRERVWPAAPLGLAWKPHATGQAASDLIRERLATGVPSMIARFGAGELDAVLRHLAMTDGNVWRSRSRYVRGVSPPPWWDAGFLSAMELHTGFFPPTSAALARFAEVMLADMKLIDILGSWLPGEQEMARRGMTAARVPLADLEPYFHRSPWSQVLRGRTVLVIHPLAKLIESQYARRSQLFRDLGVLPGFELRTMAAEVTNAGARPVFADWFAALDSMINRMSAMRFDVAIIGAGSYGLPLAAAVKRMGLQAVHLGGATQLLFGIRGKRWDDLPAFQQLFTDAWVRPDEGTRPPRWREIEGGSYW